MILNYKLGREEACIYRCGPRLLYFSLSYISYYEKFRFSQVVSIRCVVGNSQYKLDRNNEDVKLSNEDLITAEQIE